MSNTKEYSYDDFCKEYGKDVLEDALEIFKATEVSEHLFKEIIKKDVKYHDELISFFGTRDIKLLGDFIRSCKNFDDNYEGWDEWGYALVSNEICSTPNTYLKNELKFDDVYECFNSFVKRTMYILNYYCDHKGIKDYQMPNDEEEYDPDMVCFVMASLPVDKYIEVYKQFKYIASVGRKTIFGTLFAVNMVENDMIDK